MLNYQKFSILLAKPSYGSKMLKHRISDTPTNKSRQRDRVGKEVGRGSEWGGTLVYLWLSHIDVWQKPS